MLTPLLRELTAADCLPIAQAFAAQGWDKPEAQYLRYLADSQAGRRAVLLAEVDSQGTGGQSTGLQFAGYLTIVWASEYPPFREAGIPEIVDFNVLKKFQRRGIGSALMDEAERRIAAVSPVAGIGVGLDPDYGPAQILYVRRGYVPDGRGAHSHEQPLRYGEMVKVDDGLALFLTKALVMEQPGSSPASVVAR